MKSMMKRIFFMVFLDNCRYTGQIQKDTKIFQEEQKFLTDDG